MPIARVVVGRHTSQEKETILAHWFQVALRLCREVVTVSTVSPLVLLTESRDEKQALGQDNVGVCVRLDRQTRGSSSDSVSDTKGNGGRTLP